MNFHENTNIREEDGKTENFSDFLAEVNKK